MNTEPVLPDPFIEDFAADWLRLGEPGVGERLLAGTLLVLGPDGTTPVPRGAFLAAVGERGRAVADAPQASTTLERVEARPVGDRLVLATLAWSFRHGDTGTSLVSDFLLQREDGGSLRCLAYLPRTNVLDHLR
ncbi:MAG: hypothetical protein AAGC63_15255 [Propionicimonas sp.]|nr:hypothetical protein [Propionicimonas sp.]